MLVNNDDNDDDCDDGYIDNDEDVRTLKNPALEELSPGTVIPRLMLTLLEVLSQWENVAYRGLECTKWSSINDVMFENFEIPFLRRIPFFT